MFDKIIIATDYSSGAFALINDLSGLRYFGTRECLLLLSLSLAGDISVLSLHDKANLEKNLQEQRQIIEKQGFKVESRIVQRLEKNEIFRIAKEENYSLIVVGAQTSSLMNESLMGGIAYEIIHFSRNPILIIRLADKAKAGIPYIEPVRCDFNKHILFPTDFSKNADLAFEVVRQLVGAGIRKVTLMHVQDQVRIEPHLLYRLDEFNKIDEERLKSMKEVLQKNADVEVDIIITYGNPSKEIIDVVKKQPIRLVVMGSQGRGFVKELFIGSVSHNVARHAAASVFLIPAL